MKKYEIGGIKKRTDFSYVIKSVHEEIDDINDGEKIKKQLKFTYNNKNGVLVFSTDLEINPFTLNMKLAEKGLELKVLE